MTVAPARGNGNIPQPEQLLEKEVLFSGAVENDKFPGKYDKMGKKQFSIEILLCKSNFCSRKFHILIDFLPKGAKSQLGLLIS